MNIRVQIYFQNSDYLFIGYIPRSGIATSYTCSGIPSLPLALFIVMLPKAHLTSHSRMSGIPVELFKILKDDALKVLYSICQQTWKTKQWPQDWKRSVFIPILKKGSARDCSNYCTIALISNASKVMLKILQVRLQQYVNHELPNVQAGFRKGRGTRDQITNSCWIIERAREFQKNIYFCFIDYFKAFDCVDHKNLWKILRDGNTRPPDLPPETSVCRSRSNS